MFRRFGDGVVRQHRRFAVTALETGNRLERVRAALVWMQVAFSLMDWLELRKTAECEKAIVKRHSLALRSALARMLDDDPPSVSAAAWALAWFGEGQTLGVAPEPEML